MHNSVEVGMSQKLSVYNIIVTLPDSFPLHRSCTDSEENSTIHVQVQGSYVVQSILLTLNKHNNYIHSEPCYTRA